MALAILIGRGPQTERGDESKVAEGMTDKIIASLELERMNQGKKEERK